MKVKNPIVLGIFIFSLVFLSCRKTKKNTNDSEVEPKQEMVDTISSHDSVQ